MQMRLRHYANEVTSVEIPVHVNAVSSCVLHHATQVPEADKSTSFRLGFVERFDEN